MNTNFSKDFRSLCSWIPGSWATPTPRNDKVYFKLRHYLAERLPAAGDSLVSFPNRGRPVPGSRLRELTVVYPYVIRYWAEKREAHAVQRHHERFSPALPG